jgi:hypothetical protein
VGLRWVSPGLKLSVFVRSVSVFAENVSVQCMNKNNNNNKVKTKPLELYELAVKIF